jgi:hypothetical protein
VEAAGSGVNRRIFEDVVLDVGEGRIVGNESLDASMHLNLGSVLPVGY